MFRKILIVGFGTMTCAMVDGWLRAGHDRAMFEVYHPTRTEVTHRLRVHNAWPTEPYDAVLLGVKPQKIGDVADGLQSVLGPQTVLISVLAGLDLASYRGRFPTVGGIVRLMPNLACALGKSPNALVADGIGDAQREAVTLLASDLGSAEWLADETHFDLVTALCGSGPGFVYRFIDALAGAAQQLGLEETQAQRLALQMVDGATALASQADISPGALADRVASPGGMTREGLNVLDEGNALQALMRQCLENTRNRGAELAALVREQG